MLGMDQCSWRSGTENGEGNVVHMPVLQCERSGGYGIVQCNIVHRRFGRKCNKMGMENWNEQSQRHADQMLRIKLPFWEGTT